MLKMAACQLGYPLPFLVAVIVEDRLMHWQLLSETGRFGFPSTEIMQIFDNSHWHILLPFRR